ncbi:MAG: DUF2007 domain-containing protein [Paludibacteraceae bacterium]|nr:DUF2007 domain-containing protein [Paludibacteraceae bacterium]
MMGEMVFLKSFSSEIEAEIVKGMLEDNGIACVLRNSNMSSILGNIGAMNVDLLVNQEDLSKAQKLVDNHS